MPDFEKVSVAYGIKSATLASYEELDGYSEWFADKEPCLLNIHIPDDTLLIPKIKWETCTIQPELDDTIIQKVNALLQK